MAIHQPKDTSGEPLGRGIRFKAQRSGDGSWSVAGEAKADGEKKPPSEKAADGGNGDSGQQAEETSGDEQSEQDEGQ